MTQRRSTEPEPAHATLIVGPEELLVERAVEEAVSAAQRRHGAVERRTLRADGLTSGTVLEMTSPGLFGDHIVAVVRDAQDATPAVQSALVELVAAVADHVTVVLTARSGGGVKPLTEAVRRSGGREVACAEVKKRKDKVDFVSGEFARQRRRSSSEVAETLVDAVGGDLRSLAAAVAQLCADTEGRIDTTVVRRYYAGHADVSAFTIADRAVEGRAGEALRQLRYAVSSGVEPVLVIGALASSLRTLINIGAAPRGLRDADLATAVGIPAWKVRVARTQLRGWTADGAARALQAVADADAAVKGAAADPIYALEKAVVTVAASRASTAD